MKSSLLIRLFAIWIMALVAVPSLSAQQTAAIRGTVTRSDDGAPLSGVTVTVIGTGMVAYSGVTGRFAFNGVPAGEHAIEFRRLGFAPHRVTVTVAAGQTATVDAKLEARATRLAES